MSREMQQRASLLPSAAAFARSPENNDDLERDTHTPQSIPPWVYLNEDGDDEVLQPIHGTARPNTRHYKPPPSHYKPGRKWDAHRDAEPALLSLPIEEHQARWAPFMHSGPNPIEPNANGTRVVNQAWLDEHMPYLNEEQWRTEELENATTNVKHRRGLMYRGRWLISPEQLERTARVYWRLLLKNPFVPLVFRVTVLAFSAAALSVSASIFRMVKDANSDADPFNQCATRASTYMAVVIGTIAIPYVGYITWDEYLSKPLGLRSVATKVSLLLCDLYFIVFSASNVSLAFDALTDHRWACFDEIYFDPNSTNPSTVQMNSYCPNNPSICYKQKVLSGVLVVSLVAWLVTFSISVLRVVEKLRPD